MSIITLLVKILSYRIGGKPRMKIETVHQHPEKCKFRIKDDSIGWCCSIDMVFCDMGVVPNWCPLYTYDITVWLKSRQKRTNF